MRSGIRLVVLLWLAVTAAALGSAPAAAQPHGALRFFEEPGPPPAGDDPLAGGCLASRLDATIGTQRCAETPALEGAHDVAISSDGRSAYVASPDADAVVALQRAGDGSFQPAGCLNAAGTRGCGRAPGLDGAAAVAVSPDGRNVYVASRVADAVVALARDEATGGLEFIDAPGACLATAAAGCEPAAALDHATGVEVSPDGANVYVAARGSDAVAVFRRGPAGLLAQLPGPEGCVQDGVSPGADVPACAEAPALDGAFETAIDPAGRFVTVASRVSDSVLVLARGAAGALAPVAGDGGCVAQAPRPGCAATGRGLDGATSVALSPDGRNVYAASYASDSVATLRRDPDRGTLALQGCASDEREADRCAPSPAMGYGQRVAVSPDGRNVYAVARDRSAVAIFERERDGSLRQEPPAAGRTWSEGCLSWRGHKWAGAADLSAADHSDHLCARGLALYYPYGLAVSPSGGHVLVASDRSASLTTLRRETSAPDTAAPRVALTTPADGAQTTARELPVAGRAGLAFGDLEQVTVRVARADAPGAAVAEATVRVAPDGAFAATVPGLPDGTFLVTAVQRDEAGNAGESRPARVRVDATAPDAALSGGPAATTTATGADFTLRASEPGAGLSCRLDAGAWAPCGPALHRIANLARGPHRFEVTASDAAGNTDPTPAAHAWTVVAAPRISVGGRPTLRTLARRGLLVRADCDGGCRVEARVVRRAGGRALARVRRQRAGSGAVRLRVKAATRRVRRLRSAQLVIRVAGPGGEPLAARTVRLRR